MKHYDWSFPARMFDHCRASANMLRSRSLPVQHRTRLKVLNGSFFLRVDLIVVSTLSYNFRFVTTFSSK
jgi:hypothetical protein